MGIAIFNLVFASSRVTAGLLFSMTWLSLTLCSASAAELSNRTLRLELGTNTAGLPAIKQGVWVATNQPAFIVDPADDIGAWLPEELIPADGVKIKADPWRISESNGFIVGNACAVLSAGLKITWIVELAKHSSILRLHVRLTNTGQMFQPVEWFPSWSGAWQMPDGVDYVRWWDALAFTRVEKQLDTGNKVRLGSHIESSSTHSGEDAVNPYWVVSGKTTRLYFGLEWCGGWSAKLQGVTDGLTFSVRLPPEDTQLILGPGEAVDGPALFVMPAAMVGEADNRRAWISQGQLLASSLYEGPRPSFPLTYNHWYAAGWDVDASFLKRQIASMEPYGFDDFIVDAGWFDQVGSWQPDPLKFQPGEFESILSSISETGTKVGIWSSPQFITAKRKHLPPEAEDPPFYRDSLGGYLLDLAGSDFTNRLTTHVTMLRQRYSADWWKYDQAFFTEQTRAGAMKNVLAFHDALLAVREQNPDLVIENCERGGRMINALTAMTTQASWLRDGDFEALPHAQQNIELALGALDFMSPWSVYRWTNNLDRIDPQDDELTRLYCRSAMAGTWGMSTDLSEIPEHQQSVILSEIQNYRRMSPIKLASLYELRQATGGADVAGVTFYDVRRKRAAVLLYRWDRRGSFDQQIDITRLRAGLSYQVTDLDTGIAATVSSEDLSRDGVTIRFGRDRLSALVFIEPAN